MADKQEEQGIDPELELVSEEPESAFIDQLATQSQGSPINPDKKFKVNKKTSAYAYYEEIRMDLEEWWDEFNSKLDDTGNLRWKNIIQFAKSRGKTRLERELFLEMVGPEPELKPGKTMLRVPWLGDWQQRRNNGFWAPQMGVQMTQLAQAFRKRMVHWDAIRELTPYVIQEMARYEKLQEEIEQMFGGMAFNHDQSPTSDENRARFLAFFEFRTMATKWKLKLLKYYMMIYGVDPLHPQMQTTINALTQNFGNPAGMVDATGNDMSDNPKEQLELVKVARMLSIHAKTYNLPLPKNMFDEEPPKTIDVEPVTKKTNGKGGSVQ